MQEYHAILSRKYDLPVHCYCLYIGKSPPRMRTTLEKEETFGTIEAVKTVSDLFMPVAGEVLEFNEILEQFLMQENDSARVN